MLGVSGFFVLRSLVHSICKWNMSFCDNFSSTLIVLLRLVRWRYYFVKLLRLLLRKYHDFFSDGIVFD